MVAPLKNPIAFFNILHDVVRCMPAYYNSQKIEERCQRLNGFGVIKRETDIENENLKKSMRYIGKNLFYSRNWEAKGSTASGLSIDYPLLGIAQNRITLGSAFGNDFDCVNFTLYIFDQMPEKCALCPPKSYCKIRTDEEMEEDLVKLMRYVLKAINRMIYAEVNYKDGSDAEGYFDEYFLECEKSDGEVISYECKDRLINYVETKVPEADTFFEAYSDNLGVIALNLKVCFSDCNENEVLPKPNYDKGKPIVKHGDGCSVC